MGITSNKACGHRTSRAGCQANASVRRPHRGRSRGRVAVQGERLFFSGRISQHMKTRHHVDWLAAGATVLAAASWGMLLSLLGS